MSDKRGIRRLSDTVAATGACLLLFPAAAAAVTFGPATAYPVSDTWQPIQIAAGDVNGDGHLDLVTANDVTGGDEFSVLLGNGDGTFGDTDVYTTAVRPLSVAVGDFDEDGLSDPVLPSDTSNQITVYLSNGDDSFSSTDFAMGSSPNAVAVGDFNHDGHDDIVAAGNDGGNTTVTVRLGAGNGTFGDPISSATGGKGFGSLAVGDFNHDGRDDVAAAPGATAGSIAVFLANADGTLATPKDAAASPGGPNGLSVGDFNADGFADLAVGYAFASSPSVMLSQGDGTFGASQSVSTINSGAQPAVGDFNHDGRLDLAVPTASGVSVALGNGDGSFQPPADFVTGTSGGRAFAADFNGDGYDDLAFASGHDVFVLINTTGLPQPVTPASPAAPTPSLALPPLPPASVARDTSPPKVAVSLPRQSLRRALSHGLKVSVRSSEACSLSARLLVAASFARRVHLAAAKQVVVASGRGGLDRAGTKTLILKFTAKARRKLARTRSLKATLEVKARDGAGNSRTTRKSITLRR